MGMFGECECGQKIDGGHDDAQCALYKAEKAQEQADAQEKELTKLRTALGRIATIAFAHKCEEVEALRTIARDALFPEGENENTPLQDQSV